MDSGVIAGLIGGFVSVSLCSYITAKIRRSPSNGVLKFGWFIHALAWGCLCFVGFPIYVFLFDNNTLEKPNDLYWVIGSFLMFVVGAIYCFGEAFGVKGTFDEESISFRTPWTGSKVEKWDNLMTIEFFSIGNWYVLTFESGEKIRLSALLGGHHGVLNLLREKGHEFRP